MLLRSYDDIAACLTCLYLRFALLRISYLPLFDFNRAKMRWTYTLLATISLGYAVDPALNPVTSCQASVGAPVNTTIGLIQGAASDLRPEVSKYLGIPFARPPIGNLRFAPPVAVQSHQGRLNATSFVS